MKNIVIKKILGILFVICVVLCSCEDTAEKKIEKSFRNYGKENFASSNSIRDIISIEPNDTISIEMLKETAKEYISLADSGLWVNRIKPDPKYKALQNNTKVPKHLREKFQSTLDAWYYFFTGNAMKIGLSLETLKNAVAQTENDNTSFVEYNIKARIKENGVQSVKEYYAIVNNNDYENILIQDHKITTDECPESVQTLMNSIGDWVDWYAKDTEYYLKLMSILRECDLYLD